MTLNGRREVRDGLLAVRLSHNDVHCRVILEGEFDLSNAKAAKEILGEVMDAPARVVVDMSVLSFIDSAGIAMLVSLLHQEGAHERLRFVPSQFPAVTRVLQITGVKDRLTPQDLRPFPPTRLKRAATARRSESALRCE